MDRRQKKTRESIFKAFVALLSEKHYNQITVGEIIEKADIGRATFYAHFATKDFLLKDLCGELFCHISDVTDATGEKHKHIFDCVAPSHAILHLLQHLQRNDNSLLELLACENNELFLRYFKASLKELIQKEPHIFGNKKEKELPDSYWVHYVSSTFVETVKWWIENKMKESPERLSAYFLTVI